MVEQNGTKGRKAKVFGKKMCSFPLKKRGGFPFHVNESDGTSQYFAPNALPQMGGFNVKPSSLQAEGFRRKAGGAQTDLGFSDPVDLC